MPGLGPLSKRHKATCCFWGVCEPLRDFKKVCSMSRQAICMEKALLPPNLGGAGSQSSGCGTMCGAVLVRLETRIWHWPLPAGGERELSKGTKHFCLGESCPSCPCPEARQFGSSPFVPDSCCPELEFRVSESKCMCGSFKRMPGSPEALRLIQPQCPLVFKIRSYENFVALEPWAGERGEGWDPSLFRGNLQS